MSETTRVLIVEDDVRLGQLIAATLREHGFVVSVETSGDRAEARILAERPHLVLLDLGLPGVDGLTICRRVRAYYDGALVMLTARRADVDQITGLEVGADDYIVKPVDARVLVARVRSVLRRAGGVQPVVQAEPTSLQVSGLYLDRARMAATLDGAPLELTVAELRLLWALARAGGELVTRGELCSYALGSQGHAVERGLDVHLSRIRRKLTACGWPGEAIRSVRGAGYILAAP